MESSKVTIQFCEASSPPIRFNTFSKSCGTIGDNRLGEDLAYALGDVPRPVLVLAQAIVGILDRSESSTEGHILGKAARAYIARWTNYDACIAQGQKPTDLSWPDE